MSEIWYDTNRVAFVGVSSVGAGNSTEVPVFCAPVRCWIKKVSIIPKSAITGAATNNMVLTFKNKGSAGSGTDAIASVTFSNGVNVSAFDEKDFGAVSHNYLNAGDVVSLAKSENGSGMDMPDLIVKIEFEKV